MHPLKSFKCCPKCGSFRFVENNFKSKKCEDCGFVFYFNPSAATAIFITNPAGQLLVARRAKDPAKGTFDLPGGFVDMHETAEDSIVREVAEETGLIIRSPRYAFSLPNIYPYSGFDVHTIDLFFECEIDDTSTFCAADDVAELFFIDRDKIKPDQFGLGSIRKAVAIWLEK